MDFTVRDALEMEPLRQAVLRGGRDGLDRAVRFVNIMEVPDVTRWMKGGEFLVTAGFAFQEVPQLVDTIMDELDRVGVAAFGIKLGPYLQSIPENLIAHADRLGLPLIELPRDVPYMDFMLPIFENLMIRQYRILKRVEQTHDQLIDLALQGHGIPGICHKLQEIVRTPVLVIDKLGNPVAGATPGDAGREEGIGDWSEEIVSCFRKADRNRLIAQRCNRLGCGDGPELVVVPVAIHDTVDSFLVAWETERALDEVSLRALEHGATVIALESVKEKAVLETEQQVRGELLEDLVWRKYKNPELLLRRARFCDLDVRAHLAVFVLDIDDFDKYIIGKEIDREEQVQKIKQDLLQKTRHALTRHTGRTPLLLQRSDSVMGLVAFQNGEEKEGHRVLLDALCQELSAKYPSLQVSVGVGQARQGIDTLQQSYEEAKTALRVSRFLRGLGTVSFYEDLGAYCFLCDVRKSPQLRRFHQETIGKLLSYDTQNRTELLPTLDCYFRCGKNVRATAEKLFMHRNSVLYRLRKIEEVSGMRLDSPEDEFNLQLGLRMQNLRDE